jgi:hypothetical protein
MGDDKTLSTVMHKPKGRGKRRKGPAPALLVAHAPFELEPGESDRARVDPPFSVGRGESRTFCLPDRQISQEHFRIDKQGGTLAIEDLGSTNGTFLGSERLEPGQPRPLTSPALIRAGETVLVFRDDAEDLLRPSFLGDCTAFGMAGPFHDPAILARLREAAQSRRAPLLAGPSGSGKELAAGALARFWDLDPPRRYNVSAAASPEEMSRALFGVAKGAYTGVEQQDGLIVTADRAGQPLFLDEVHNLPLEAQATLLTVIEDKKFTRKGAEHKELEVDVRFVFASNEPDRLKPDLRARLWQVDLPPLEGRVADVPALFDHLLALNLEGHGIDVGETRAALDADFYLDLCLEVLKGSAFAATNVRGLLDLADRIGARISTGVEPDQAVDSVLDELGIGATGAAAGGDAGGGQYERYRELISAVYRGSGRNAKKTVELLKDSGVPWTISRRHLNNYVKKWGLKEG